MSIGVIALVLERLLTRFCSLNLEGTSEIVDLGQVDIEDVISCVIISDLAASPVKTFDFDDLAVLDGATEGD